jgi:integrase
VDKDRGLFFDPAMARTPLAEVAAAWLGSNPAKRDGSWQRDEIAIRRHIVPVLGDRPIGSLTPADVQALVNRWSAVRAPRTVRRDYGVLQSIVNYAVRLDMVGRSPCRGINLPRAKPVRRHVVDAADLARLAKALGGVGELGPMVYLGAVEGLRWGEVAGLRVGQVDVAARTVAVVETIVRGRKGAVGVGEPKSDAGRRTLPIPAVLADMLSDHMAAVGLTPLDREALLFRSPGGGPLRTRTGCAGAGIRRPSPRGWAGWWRMRPRAVATTSAWGSTTCAVGEVLRRATAGRTRGGAVDRHRARAARKRHRGPVTRPSATSRVGEI